MTIRDDNSGQSTVEFALIGAALLSVVIAIALLWHVFESGLFIEHALAGASHHVQSVSAGVVGDVFLY